MRFDLDEAAHSDEQGLGRRVFLQSLAATGLLLATHIPGGSKRALAAAPAEASTFAPNAFVRITPDNWVTVIVKHHEMGQGTTTGIATLVAEELDADFARVHAEYAPSDPRLYNNTSWGATQGTGGSSAIKAGWQQMRNAGAAARAMLVQAAAEVWQVPAAEIAVVKGVLTHRSGKRGTFGEFAIAAGKQAVPAKPTLKDPKTFTLIGKNTTRRLDSQAKCTGKAIYTADVKLPGLLSAVVARPPTFGGKLHSFDASEALKVPGVTDVVKIPEGVAVLAKGMWAALKGREALKLQWDAGPGSKLSTEQMFASYRELAKKPGDTVVKNGGTAAALRNATRTIEAVYELPYLAHATMEPMNCVAWLHDGVLETWAGHQIQTLDHKLAAKAAGLPLEKVKLNTLISGGSFGRRANPFSDYVVEAVHIAKAIDGRAPVRLQFTREDDMRAGLYRPLYVHAAKLGLDKDGKLLGWQHTIVGQSIQAGGPFSAMVKRGVDETSVEGVWPTQYTLPNLTVLSHAPTQPVRVLWWRSVGHTHTAFVMETLIDELAEAAKQDPIEYRRGLLKDKPRQLAALKLVAEKSGWGTPLAPGRARGVALHESFDTVVAQVVEVILLPSGMPRVLRVVVAVDCGTVVNPDIVRAQMEGGVGFALAAALYGEINIEQGRAREGNFDQYRALRIEEMPQVEVFTVPSDAAPTGVGEPGVPPLAPAVANALFELTGERVRRLPFRRSLQKGRV